jgi:hypothetical protein
MHWLAQGLRTLAILVVDHPPCQQILLSHVQETDQGPVTGGLALQGGALHCAVGPPPNTVIHMVQYYVLRVIQRMEKVHVGCLNFKLDWKIESYVLFCPFGNFS